MVRDNFNQLNCFRFQICLKLFIFDYQAQFVDDVASDVDLGVDNSELDDDPIVKWTVEEGGENRDDESNGGWDDGFDDQVADDCE